jgi:hypothetical protein
MTSSPPTPPKVIEDLSPMFLPEKERHRETVFLSCRDQAIPKGAWGFVTGGVAAAAVWGGCHLASPGFRRLSWQPKLFTAFSLACGLCVFEMEKALQRCGDTRDQPDKLTPEQAKDRMKFKG